MCVVVFYSKILHGRVWLKSKECTVTWATNKKNSTHVYFKNCEKIVKMVENGIYVAKWVNMTIMLKTWGNAEVIFYIKHFNPLYSDGLSHTF